MQPEKDSKIGAKEKIDIYITRRFASYIADDPYFTEPMRDILYTRLRRRRSIISRGRRRSRSVLLEPAGRCGLLT